MLTAKGKAFVADLRKLCEQHRISICTTDRAGELMLLDLGPDQPQPIDEGVIFDDITTAPPEGDGFQKQVRAGPRKR